MTDKEFRRLKRIELVDIIYKLQNNEERLQERIEQLEKELENKEIKLSKAGSIAEAALSLNDVFASAQSAADLYVQEVHRMYIETRVQTDDDKAASTQALEQAKAQAAQIVADAEAKRDEMLSAAQSEIDKKWQEFREGTQQTAGQKEQ